MGLFDKLFGDAKLDELKQQFNEFEKAMKDAGIEVKKNEASAKPAEASDPLKDMFKVEEKKNDSYDDDRPKSGVSWGEEMPDEENQFNFNGKPHVYFKKIFDENFSGKYSIEAGFNTEYEGYLFTFYSLSRKALVVELLKKKSGAKKLRRDTIDAGIPYLRYYTDVDGWWNTKSYVIDRTRKALEG
ncbi:MAG: hypothetical protein IKR78_03310 [Dehalococcoidales bacterium]|nr:hypothetical protein [Dehalococcoidales bacterium]